MDIILIDHYDSFSMNVLDWLERAGFSVSICPHDSSQMEKLLETASEMVSHLANPRSAQLIHSGSKQQRECSPVFDTPENLESGLSSGLIGGSRAKSMFSDQGILSSTKRAFLPGNSILRTDAILPSDGKLPLVFGPGPKAPKDYPNSMKLLALVLYHWPILGVCLGHQMLGAVAGLEVRRSKDPHHGSKRDVFFESASPLFHGVNHPMSAATYNSLVICGEVNDPWRISARNQMGEIEALENLKGAGAFGIQFHPESFLSPAGPQIAKNWLDFVRSLALPV